jgi:hypothetical protein
MDLKKLPGVFSAEVFDSREFLVKPGVRSEKISPREAWERL